MRRDAALHRGGSAGHLRAATATASLLAVGLLAGCASPADDSLATLEMMVAERDRVAAGVLSEDLARSASFLRDRWGPVSLPDEAIVRWVAAREWGTVMSECLEGEGVLGARPADDGERIDFSGVTAESPRELFEADVAVYSCQARYPVRAWYAAEVAEFEAPWAWEYSADVVVPCLLAAGYRPPSLPDTADFVEDWAAGEAWDPYPALAADPRTIERARAQCPPAQVVLDSVP